MRILRWRRGFRRHPRTLTPSDVGRMTQTGHRSDRGRVPPWTLANRLCRWSIVGLVAALVLGALGVVIGLLVSNELISESQPRADCRHRRSRHRPLSNRCGAGADANRLRRRQRLAPSNTSDSCASTCARSASRLRRFQQLRQFAADDRDVVRSERSDLWVPQLSSKRPGVVDEGLVWNNALTLQEHLRLRAAIRREAAVVG